jgi:hypothetical protein
MSFLIGRQDKERTLRIKKLLQLSALVGTLNIIITYSDLAMVRFRKWASRCTRHTSDMLLV